MLRWIALVKYLFREILLYNLIFTGIAAGLIYEHGQKSFVFAFWIKAAGFIFSGLTYYMSRRRFLYFFHNLGFSRNDLIVTACVIDFILSIIIFFLTYSIRT